MTRESPEARAERILAELRAATAEAAGVLKDLDAAAKRARRQVDGYLHDEVQKAHNEYTAQLQAGADKFITDHLAHLDKCAEKVARQAETTIRNAGTIDALVKATAEAIAARTIMINGEPHVVYGNPDLGEFKVVDPE